MGESLKSLPETCCKFFQERKLQGHDSQVKGNGRESGRGMRGGQAPQGHPRSCACRPSCGRDRASARAFGRVARRTAVRLLTHSRVSTAPSVGPATSSDSAQPRGSDPTRRRQGLRRGRCCVSADQAVGLRPRGSRAPAVAQGVAELVGTMALARGGLPATSITPVTVSLMVKAQSPPARTTLRPGKGPVGPGARKDTVTVQPGPVSWSRAPPWAEPRTPPLEDPPMAQVRWWSPVGEAHGRQGGLFPRTE